MTQPSRNDPTSGDDQIANKEWLSETAKNQVAACRNITEFVALVVARHHKAEAVATAVEGPLTASCPASVLRLHPHVTVVVDEAAAPQLKTAEF
jgi:6-phosphogluconolactonase/glucosamine-6-phosphate isomerase/deaminase